MRLAGSQNTQSRLDGHTRFVAVRFGLLECSVYFKSESILTEDDPFVTYIILLLRYIWQRVSDITILIWLSLSK